MIIETEGDLIKNIKPWSVILHQVNCLGIAGAGVALQIREMFPGWYIEYKTYCDQENDKKLLLGKIHSYQAKPDVIICSAFAQFGISKSAPVTDYKAWDQILMRLERELVAKNAKDSMNWHVVAPYGIGCGLAGGDWNTMRDLFEFYFAKSPVQLTFVKKS